MTKIISSKKHEILTKHVPYPLCSKSARPKSCLHTQLTFPLPHFPIKRLPRVISKGFYQKSENPKIPNYISTPDPLLKQPLVILRYMGVLAVFFGARA